jgi:hypothetical protein
MVAGHFPPDRKHPGHLPISGGSDWEEAIEQAKRFPRGPADCGFSQRSSTSGGWPEIWMPTWEMAAVVTGMSSMAEPAAAEQWLAWLGEYRQRIDPLHQPIRMPPERKPSKEELKPFLNGWNPYGPETEYWQRMPGLADGSGTPRDRLQHLC